MKKQFVVFQGGNWDFSVFDIAFFLKVSKNVLTAEMESLCPYPGNDTFFGMKDNFSNSISKQNMMPS